MIAGGLLLVILLKFGVLLDDVNDSALFKLHVHPFGHLDSHRIGIHVNDGAMDTGTGNDFVAFSQTVLTFLALRRRPHVPTDWPSC